jgi:hypothetical protein
MMPGWFAETLYTPGPPLRASKHTRTVEGGAVNCGVVICHTQDADPLSRPPKDAVPISRRAENAGRDVPEGNVLLPSLAVNADPVERRAGDAGEIARRAVHAGAVRLVVQYACEVDRPPAPNNAAESAICYRTEPVAQGRPRGAAGIDIEGCELFGRLVSAENRMVNIGGETHGSLLGIKIRRPGRSPRSSRRHLRASANRRQRDDACVSRVDGIFRGRHLRPALVEIEGAYRQHSPTSRGCQRTAPNTFF